MTKYTETRFYCNGATLGTTITQTLCVRLSSCKQHLSLSLSTSCHEGTGRQQRYSSTEADLSSRSGWTANATPLAFYPLERDPVPIVREAERSPLVQRKESLHPPGFRTPNRPACGEQLHRQAISNWVFMKQHSLAHPPV